MPSVCRRIAALLAVACLGGAAAAPIVHAQSAGDQQYSDPFAGSGGKKQQRQSTTTGGHELSPTPQTPAAATPSPPASRQGATGPLTARKPAPPAQATLPNTGIDARVLLIVGTVLLLTGLGLRLRSAPERF